ncbi:MAG: hypothetical protein R3F61_29495 [Myxococcota bacterium]
MNAAAPNLTGEAEPTAADLQELALVAHSRVEESVRTYPYVAMAAGLGVGVVLGGGIPNWALRLAASGLARVAVAHAVSRAMPMPADDE